MSDLTARWIEAGGDLTFNEWLDHLDQVAAAFPGSLGEVDAIARDLYSKSFAPLMSPEELHQRQRELIEEFKQHEAERLRNTAIGPAQIAPLLVQQQSTLYWQTANRNLGFLGAGLGSVIGGIGGSLSW